GSGLALIAAGERGLELHDASDPSVTYNFLTQIDTRGRAKSIAVAGGIAFVANGAEGLAVVSYLPFDNQGQPPQVSIASADLDVDPNTPGVQVTEGDSLPIAVEVSDDVQVRNVELLVNGEVVRNDISFPFDLEAIALNEAGDDVGVQVRATDTGGNATLSDSLTFQLVPDTFGPSIVETSVSAGETIGPSLRRLEITFSEPMAAATISPANLRIFDAADQAISTDVELRSRDRRARVGYGVLPEGDYRFVIDAPAITDRAGNPLGDQPIAIPFTVARSAIRWVGGFSDRWTDADNWDLGELPGADHDVTINPAGAESIFVADVEINIASLTVGGSGTPSLRIADGALKAIGSVEIASGAVLEIHQGGRLDAESINNRGELRLIEGGVIAGDLTNQNLFAVETRDTGSQDSGPAVIDGAVVNTAAGTLRVTPDDEQSTQLRINGDLLNAGAIELGTADSARAATLLLPRDVLVNESSGVVESLGQMGNLLTAELDNRGLIRSESRLTIDGIGADHHNTGRVEVQSGGLTLSRLFRWVNEGDVTVGDAAAFQFRDGLFEHLQGNFDVGGDWTISSGVVQLGGELDTAGIGALRLSGTLGVNRLINAAGKTVEFLDGGAVDGDLENHGAMIVINGGNEVSGAFTNAAGGTLTLDGSGFSTVVPELRIGGDASNAGTIEFLGRRKARLRVDGGPLVNEAAVTIHANGTPQNRFFLHAALENRGIVVTDSDLEVARSGAQHRHSGDFRVNQGILTFSQSGANASLVSTGTITVNDPGSTLGLVIAGGEFRQSGGAISLNGALDIRDTTFTADAGSFAFPDGFWDAEDSVINILGDFSTAGLHLLELTDSTLNISGTLTHADDETLRLIRSTVVGDVVNQGILDVPGSSSTIDGALTNAKDAIVLIRAQGPIDQFRPIGDAELRVTGGVQNSGFIFLEEEQAGQGENDTAAISVTGGPLNNEFNGVIKADSGIGRRRIVATVENDGVLQANQDLVIDGDLRQASNGALNFPIPGADQFGAIEVTGVVVLNGLLNAIFENGFSPAVGSRFELLTYTSHSGTIQVFARQLPPDRGFTTEVDAAGLTMVIGSALRSASRAELLPEASVLDAASLQSLFDSAVARWGSAGVSLDALARLHTVDVRVAELSGDLLGLATADTVWIDADAAGHGWFMDDTPEEDEEFSPTAVDRVFGALDGGPADGRIALVTVLLHELGHVLGRDDHDGGLMAEILAPGVRKTP
ncbi:MAG: Ig-like domain-containing protein, partial [Planctomycetes bacterium]|nr:Ig-like domain-containing protein [Planctomycetota bacterium]